MSTRRTSSFWGVLVPHIVQMSRADNWESARHEWQYTRYERALFDADYSCSCEYHPIVHLHTITNVFSKAELIVGCCCIQQFLGLSDAELRGLARVRGNATMPLNESAIRLAHAQGWINEWERDFCLNTRLKRGLSWKQRDKRIQINETVLDRLSPVVMTQQPVG